MYICYAHARTSVLDFFLIKSSEKVYFPLKLVKQFMLQIHFVCLQLSAHQNDKIFQTKRTEFPIHPILIFDTKKTFNNNNHAHKMIDQQSKCCQPVFMENLWIE